MQCLFTGETLLSSKVPGTYLVFKYVCYIKNAPLKTRLRLILHCGVENMHKIGLGYVISFLEKSLLEGKLLAFITSYF